MTTTTNVSVTTFPLTIDYRKPLAEMVRAGRYRYVNPDINPAHFPIEGDGEVQTEVILVHFDRYIESDDVIAELDEQGLVPAKIEHLLTLGGQHPDLQRQYSIVCLGSVWTGPLGVRRVPCLVWWDGGRMVSLYCGRMVSLYCWPDEWSRYCRFAAVRKLPVPTL